MEDITTVLIKHDEPGDATMAYMRKGVVLALVEWDDRESAAPMARPIIFRDSGEYAICATRRSWPAHELAMQWVGLPL